MGGRRTIRRRLACMLSLKPAQSSLLHRCWHHAIARRLSPVPQSCSACCSVIGCCDGSAGSAGAPAKVGSCNSLPPPPLPLPVTAGRDAGRCGCGRRGGGLPGTGLASRLGSCAAACRMEQNAFGPRRAMNIGF